MAQQLAMDTRELTLRDMKEFLAKAEEYDLPLNLPLKTSTHSEEVPVSPEEQEQEQGMTEKARIYFKFAVEIPESKRRRVVTVKKKKIEKQVEEQIEQHKEDVKAGKKVAHVPPVKGTVKRKSKKKRTKKEEPVVETPVLTDPDLPDEDYNESEHIKNLSEHVQMPPKDESRPAKKKKSKKSTTAYKTEKTDG